MRVKDNHTYSKYEFVSEYPLLSDKLLDKTLLTLSQNENLLVFPHDFLTVDDMDHDSKIVETVNDTIKTQNIIGFIGYQGEQLDIHSRFSDGNDHYFLHYMLQKVLNINIVNLDTQLSMKEQFYQLLMYLFPRYLNSAMRKGMFKQYQRFDHNDLHIKGSIDIPTHIKKNTPFVGKVAYSTREFTQNNDLMQLVRHTIEYILVSSKNSRMILNSSEVTKQNVSAVRLATPTYKSGSKRSIIIANRNMPVRHAYYTEYLALQKLCLMILTHKRHGFSGDSKNIHGILFDVAWLWEEYLNTLLKNDFLHPRNKKSKEGISLFSDRTRTVYPDFYNRNRGVVIDAKYKKLEDTDKGISREDLYQVISYTYILRAKSAGIVYPSSRESKKNHIGTLAGYYGNIFKLSLRIPKYITSYKEFYVGIQESEHILKVKIEDLLE
ncbi:MULTISPECIES: McrC family protein [Enterococcus]|uniref:McrC family protein n=1 Tax=Enterococcus TaxID=1350 RepID=UPI00201909EA|nr:MULTISPECIES: McrC family protein [Enterococcus]MDT2341245.1 McrC family protein [Enterococcus faecium]MDV7738481.1 McrC family protein [Enterococcus casseliflavus]MDV7743434.1 McrC family protein [Enterococcus gallinarum]MDV7773033.1 McrC family protein [Enterococcus hirae]UQR02384.1 McrC family protein [Enterococcus gallinarum]